MGQLISTAKVSISLEWAKENGDYFCFFFILGCRGLAEGGGKGGDGAGNASGPTANLRAEPGGEGRGGEDGRMMGRGDGRDVGGKRSAPRNLDGCGAHSYDII